MPSPFPGMDPYLEGDNWTSFHTHLATEIARQLTSRFVSRAEQRPMVHVWPIGLDHPLPAVPVPLLPGDADVDLDLQACFQNVYDLGGFDLVLDYAKPPPVALRDDQAAWVAERLRAVDKGE